MRRRAHDCLSFEPEATTRGHLGDRTEAPPRMSIAVRGILAIEAEARASAPLDVERLNLAAYRTPEKRGETRKEWLTRVAAEYARLTTEGEKP